MIGSPQECEAISTTPITLETHKEEDELFTEGSVGSPGLSSSLFNQVQRSESVQIHPDQGLSPKRIPIHSIYGRSVSFSDEGAGQHAEEVLTPRETPGGKY